MIAEVSATGYAVWTLIGVVVGAGAVLLTLWLMQQIQKDNRYR